MNSTRTPANLVIRGGTVVRPGQPPRIADIVVNDGMIREVVDQAPADQDAMTVDATGLHIFPGVIDLHSHLGAGNGLQEYETETGAAALGGVTTIFNILADAGEYAPTVAEHLEAAGRTAKIDFGLHLTLMSKEHLQELPKLKEEFGIHAYKYFMSFRGDEGKYLGVEGTDDGKMFEIFATVAANNALLFVHAENPEIVWALRDRLQAEGRTDLAAWDDARPPFAEAEAVRRVAYFAQSLGTRVYLVHISTSDSIEQIKHSRAEFPDLSLAVETCPHYLTHTRDYAGRILGKVNPPLRKAEHRDALWQAVSDGVVDTVASDHVSRKRSTKEGTIWTASAGFPGSPTIMPSLITHGHLERGLPLERIAELTSRRPAELLGLSSIKGDIAPGLDADLALVDLSSERTADPEWLGTNSDYSLPGDEPLRGWARHVFVRGIEVVRDHAVVAEPGTGNYVRRTPAEGA
ncbi:dihydroorotase [Ruicaihuangia caeni]|uniref:Dihydroorotase family protein n=1 Tax=Ruicaihuangia caeni TaxID=3042517 RepID=A0AAW6TDJ1_9MICO|nr:dihydroorotase family protein [Klugiella sp. YN-L-19]MDI2099137.1 dihydroorotase family protein [Klugiella sp. YN-L-19]